MSKQAGLGQRLYIGGNDISGDIQSAALSGGPAPLDVTDITQSAFSRLGGERDGKISAVSYWDPALAHPVLSALPTSDQILTYSTGAAIGSPAACLNGRQINYDGTRGTDGSFTFAVEAQADGFGLEWGQLLTAGMRTDTAAANGTSLDTGGALSLGWQAYLHVSAFSGTDVTVKVQDSADNSSFLLVTAATFTSVTSAPLAQRITGAASATVRQFVRVATSTTGGFTSVTFAVVFVKNTAAVTF